MISIILIQTALNKFSSDFRKALIEFRNKQIRGRVGRKSLTIPKTNCIWIKLLDASEFDGVTTLQEIIIQNVYTSKELIGIIMPKVHIQQMHSQILNFSMMLIERTIIVISIIIHLGGQWITFFIM